MSIKIIEDRIRMYNPQSLHEEIQAFKEVCQSIVLLALFRANLFKRAAFQGGTCLRILYGLHRFSEDLDFILMQPDTTFEWQPYAKALEDEFHSYGIALEIKDRSKSTAAVKSAFLKEQSIGKVLHIDLKRPIMIKLEIDSNPPSDSLFETRFVDFPIQFPIVAQDESSLFASKCHALLCRKYPKGRDWYDFLWYMSRKTQLNYKHLESALYQAGPWANQAITMNKQWLLEALTERIHSLDWEHAKKDVRHFLKLHDQKIIDTWDSALFLSVLPKLPER